METKIFEIDRNKINKEEIRKAAALLKKGGLVAFPTETVYGLGGGALSKEIVEKIFIAKGRPSDNPLIVHIHSIDQLDELVEEIPEEARILAKEFWPGPLTLIFQAKKSVPENVTGGLNTVGIRMPSDPVALEFLKATDMPVAAPSANISGRPSPTKGEHVVEDLSGKIDGIIISSDSVLGIESTVLDITVKPALILRPGSVTLEDIHKLIDVRYDVSSSMDKPRSPGTKYRHYAPKCDLYIVKGDLQKKITKFSNIFIKNSGKKIGLLTSKELASKLDCNNIENIVFKVMGSINDPQEIVSNLYKNLREFDKENIDVIYMEDIPEEITGKAYQNRTEKASGGKVL